MSNNDIDCLFFIFTYYPVLKYQDASIPSNNFSYICFVFNEL